jgi:diguanylate cyclase (GGDEF)-like protein/PAS domain S-box-containing protein
MATNRYSALRKVTWAMFALVSLALLGGTAWVIRLNTEVLDRRIDREARTLRTLLVDQLASSFATVDGFFAHTVPLVSADPRQQATALHEARLHAPSPHLRALLVVDAQGRILSSEASPGLALGDRIPEPWPAQRATSPSGMHLATPADWPGSGQPVMLLSRPLEPGSAQLYLAGVLDLGFFRELLNRSDEAGNNAWFIALVQDQHARLLARNPDQPGAAVHDITLPENAVRALAEGRMPLPMPAAFAIDKRPRLLYYGRLPDQPLYAGIGLSATAVGEELRVAGLRNGAFAGLALLIVAFLFGSLLQQLRVAERKDADEIRARTALGESEARFSKMIEASPQAVTISSLDDDTVVEANRASLELIGRTREDVIGHTADELNVWADPGERRQFIADLRREGTLNAREIRVRRRDGEVRDLLASATLVEIAGRPMMLLTAMDVSARHRAEEALRISEERLRATLDNTPAVAVQQYDEQGRVLYWNKATEVLCGFSAEEALGKTLDQLIWTPAQATEWLGVLREVARVGAPRGPIETAVRRRDGAERFVVYTVFAIPETGGGSRFVCMSVDITERKLAEERIQYLATRDALTGLPNRLLLADRLSQAMATAKREGKVVAVLFMDLDRFKVVNDSLGHDVGDRLLREVADRIVHSMRDDDTLARIGGDEFVMVAHGLRSSDAATRIARKTLVAMAKPFVIDGKIINTFASIGISTYPGDASTPQGLLRCADIAMYQAKEHGGSRYEYYSEPMNARLVERQQIEARLRVALADNALGLVYQPKVGMRTGRITGAEALLRWDDPELGSVSPEKFISVAEETGLIVPLGRWVMLNVLRQLSTWVPQGWAVPVSINLSVRQFTEALVDDVERALRDARVDPRWLELEITENVFLHEVEDNLNFVERLSDLGVAVTLDDFGTGYSSFSYLKRFAVGGIKIDQSFVSDVIHPQDASIVGAIVAMAHNLGLKTVAEGVEGAEQLEVLRGLGCDEYQGYLFSRPLTALGFEALLSGVEGTLVAPPAETH